jgi:hypothetical protein
MLNSWTGIPNILVNRRVFAVRTTGECQTQGKDEFTAQFYCVKKGVVFQGVSLPRQINVVVAHFADARTLGLELPG